MYRSREIETRVRDSLRSFRVVSLTGARQVGKTTLVQRLCREDGRRFVSLEDPVERAAAQADPDGWLESNPAPLAIDEIQHVPALFPALKRRVDRDHRPGRYLITGSALWLSMKSIGESLAGRTAILELWPFRPSEWRSAPWRWDLVLGPDDGPVRSVRPGHAVGAVVWERILRGGYPEPAGFASAADRRTWHESYLRTYLQRDVLDLIRVERMSEFTRLIRLLAGQTGAMANQSALARDLGLPQPTVRRHIEWLRTTYQCHELPPYSTNLGKRLVKTPKLYWSDTGMAAALAGLRDREAVESAEKSGAMVETWVVNDLRAWSSQSGDTALFFWRAHDGGEVDVLIERGGAVVGVEIKAGHRVDARDLKGLRECRAALGARFRRGIVLYGGSEPHALEDRLFALPLSVLLGERDG
jgi:predicted AAA+ superfamily ATPase